MWSIRYFTALTGLASRALWVATIPAVLSILRSEVSVGFTGGMPGVFDNLSVTESTRETSESRWVKMMTCLVCDSCTRRSTTFSSKSWSSDEIGSSKIKGASWLEPVVSARNAASAAIRVSPSLRMYSGPCAPWHPTKFKPKVIFPLPLDLLCGDIGMRWPPKSFSSSTKRAW
ncbi:hypothetical protein D3C76_938990 [compost metagenome]